MLVDLFDWLDGLEPQLTVDVVPRYHNTLISTSRVAAKMAMCSAVMKMAQEKVQVGVRKVMQYFAGYQRQVKSERALDVPFLLTLGERFINYFLVYVVQH